MSGRLSEVKSVMVNGKCLNRKCDAKSVCSVYSAFATDDERDRYLEFPMIQCPLFVLKNQPKPRENEVYFESF